MQKSASYQYKRRPTANSFLFEVQKHGFRGSCNLVILNLVNVFVQMLYRCQFLTEPPPPWILGVSSPELSCHFVWYIQVPGVGPVSSSTIPQEVL